MEVGKAVGAHDPDKAPVGQSRGEEIYRLPGIGKALGRLEAGIGAAVPDIGAEEGVVAAIGGAEVDGGAPLRRAKPVAGRVEDGPKQVVIDPLNVKFGGDELNLR